MSMGEKAPTLEQIENGLSLFQRPSRDAGEMCVGYLDAPTLSFDGDNPKERFALGIYLMKDSAYLSQPVRDRLKGALETHAQRLSG